MKKKNHFFVGLVESIPKLWNKIQTFVLIPRHVIHKEERFLMYNWSIFECEQSRIFAEELKKVQKSVFHLDLPNLNPKT